MNKSVTISYEEGNELDTLYAINRAVDQAEEWKVALDEIVKLIRRILVFDNLVLYIPDPVSANLEVGYARAVGRGRAAGADISWGESVATQVYSSRQVYLQEPVSQPQNNESENRLEYPFLLGIPLQRKDHILGILVFIRFGGPVFDHNNTRLAIFIGEQITHLLERQYLNRIYTILQDEQQQSQLQDDFITTISHELLTPLGFIKGYATTLLRSDTSWDENSRREFLTIIDQETDRLQELIDNILDSARLQSGLLTLEIQPISMDVLIRDVIMRIHLSHKNFQVSLKNETPIPHIQGDPHRLAQVFENLLSNAIKYAPGSPVSITLNKEKDWVNVTVTDKGPGISPQYVPHLFERFFRSPDRAMNVRGTGLGLYICRQIIDAHQGKISVESVLGDGTSVHISLPVHAKAKASIPSNK